jgi:hypothetical protein
LKAVRMGERQDGADLGEYRAGAVLALARKQR